MIAAAGARQHELVVLDFTRLPAPAAVPGIAHDAFARERDSHPGAVGQAAGAAKVERARSNATRRSRGQIDREVLDGPLGRGVLANAPPAIQVHVDQDVQVWRPDQDRVKAQANPVPTVGLDKLLPLGAGELTEYHPTVDHECAVFD